MTMAKLLKHAHLVQAAFWLLMIPLSMYMGWDKLVRFVTFISLWALVITEVGAWQGSRAEVKVEETSQISADHVDVENAETVSERKG